MFVDRISARPVVRGSRSLGGGEISGILSRVTRYGLCKTLVGTDEEKTL